MIPALFVGVSGIMSAGFIEGAGPAAEGTVFFPQRRAADQVRDGKAFMDAYAKAGYREDLDAYGPFAFSAANLIMDAIEKVGPDRKKVRDILNTTKGYKALVGEINFDDHRQNIVSANVYAPQDGKWAYWPDSAYATGTKKLPGKAASNWTPPCAPDQLRRWSADPGSRGNVGEAGNTPQ